MSALKIASGERILDVGCGIGSTPQALAKRVGPSGRVDGIDLSPAAIEVAQASCADLPNVFLRAGDAQSFPFEPRSFDAAFSRFGVMFFADPVAAFSNLRHALRPGGRLGFICWRPLDENELDHLPLRAASACLPDNLVEEAASSAAFSLSEPHNVRQTLAEAGFTDIEVEPHDARVGSGDLQAMVEVCSRVGALGKILRDHPDLRRRAVPTLARALKLLDGPGGPRLTAATWLVRARKP